MIALPSNPRYERKFLAEGLALPEVLALVHRHPAAFRETYPPRTVNNIYLDSPDLRDYRDHVNGIAHRSKTRIRWYGAWAGPIAAPTLEHKLKLGQLSGKESHGLPPLLMNGFLSKAGLEAALGKANLPGRARADLAYLMPSLLNRYRRHYFQSGNRKVRLTVDSELQFAGARGASGAAVSFCSPAPMIVIELKFSLGDAEAAAVVTNAAPFRLARCSKYLLGINRIAGS